MRAKAVAVLMSLMSCARAGGSVEVTVPPGSGDYRAMLALARKYRAGSMTLDDLARTVSAARLPPHQLGCAYLVMPVPAPPPGVPYDPGLMPEDFEGTFGEVAMTHFAGALTREEYDVVHAAAHRSEAGFPDCRR